MYDILIRSDFPLNGRVLPAVMRVKDYALIRVCCNLFATAGIEYYCRFFLGKGVQNLHRHLFSENTPSRYISGMGLGVGRGKGGSW